jgi:hypothetical protein
MAKGALVGLDEKTRDGTEGAVTNANENVGRKVLAQRFDRQRHRAHVLDLIADGNIAVRLMALIRGRAFRCRSSTPALRAPFADCRNESGANHELSLY